MNIYWNIIIYKYCLKIKSNQIKFIFENIKMIVSFIKTKNNLLLIIMF